MAFKFPFTNYHELNLTWVLEQLKSLFEKSEENITTIETYDGRLSTVEAELPVISETASEASLAAAAAGTLAQTAKATADTAQNNAIQAQGLAGTARQEAQAAQTAANEATQAAQQAQATAQNFDGRITQAENDASQALEASRSFENRVQSAITTANNANQTATNAQGIAMRADQNAGAALDKIGDLSQLITTAKQNLVVAINEAAQSGAGSVTSVNGKTGAVVLNAGDIGYNDTTVETALGGKQNAPALSGVAGQVLGLNNSLQPVWVDQTGGSGDNSNCAPLIINTASGAIASFSDGADNRQIRKIVALIEPVQSGTGDPSPDNVRPISGRTGANVRHSNENLIDVAPTGAGGTKRWYKNTGILLKAGVKYTLKTNVASGIAVYFRNIDDNDVLNNCVITGTGTSRATCVPNVDVVASLKTYAASASVYPDDFILELTVDENADVVAHRGETLYINWETEAGTVYGGTVTLNEDGSTDVVNTSVYAKLNTLSWSYFSNAGYFRTTEGSVANYSNASAPLAEIYKSVPSISSSTPDMQIGWAGNRLAVKDTRYTDASLWLSAVGNYSTVMYLKPENQTTYHFDNIGQLKTFLGVNNVWADTGDVEVTYPADTKLYIDNKIAELQALVLEQ